MTFMMMTALLLGLAGSGHCLGMCGPLATIVPGSGVDGRWGRILDRLIYHIGRVAAYASIGIVASVGLSVVEVDRFERPLAIVSGVLMIVIALMPLLTHRSVAPRWVTARWSTMAQWFARRLRGRPTVGRTFLLGMVNGYLPCGLVIAAVAGAMGTGHPDQAALFMMMFGLGTVPALFILGIALSVGPPRLQGHLRRLTPVLTVVAGVLILVRGLGLGIPYLSPAPVAVVTASCCQHH